MKPNLYEKSLFVGGTADGRYISIPPEETRHQVATPDGAIELYEVVQLVCGGQLFRLFKPQHLSQEQAIRALLENYQPNNIRNALEEFKKSNPSGFESFRRLMIK